MTQKIFASNSGGFLLISWDWLREELQACPSPCRLSFRAVTAFTQCVTDERCPLDTKLWELVKVISPQSVTVIYSYHSDLQSETEEYLVNVCREWLCHYLLLNMDDCTRWHGNSISTMAFFYDPWQSTKSQINIHSETSKSRTLVSEQQWNVIYVNRRVCSVVTRS